MAKQRKAWTFRPGKKLKTALPGTLKDEVDAKARELIETVFKPKHVQPPPTGRQLNYITDITTKWLGSKCYFVSIYACPGPKGRGQRRCRRRSYNAEESRITAPPPLGDHIPFVWPSRTGRGIT